MLTGTLADTPASPFPDIDFHQASRVVVAVSGGSDSIALLVLLHEHLTSLAAPPRIVAVTVDHGLRVEAAVEARTVAAFCAELGIEHRTRHWSGPKPASGIAAAARAARYGLLAETAAEIGAGMILAGHTADDQAETVTMRAARGDGRGLAGMAPATLLDGSVWLVRPLLALRRGMLRSMLVARGIGWIDDPTNSNTASERVRIRAILGETAIADALWSAGDNARGRAEIAARAARLIELHAALASPGLVQVDAAILDEADRDAAGLAVSLLAATVGGAEHPVSTRGAASLLVKLDRPGTAATVSRAVVARRRDGLFLHRETRLLPTETSVASARTWDGRYRIAADDAAGLRLAPLGRAGIDDVAAGDRAATPRPALARTALVAEPALWRDGTCLGLARDHRESGFALTPLVAPYARFLPGFDLPLAATLAGLVGAPLPGAPPCRSHTLPAA